MKKTKLSRLRKNRGFTLLEVVITIAIVLIFTAIGSYSYKKVVKDSRRAACLQQQEVLWTAKRMAWSIHEDLSSNPNADDVIIGYLDQRELPFCPDAGTHKPASGQNATIAHLKASFDIRGQDEDAKPVCRINPDHIR